MDLFDTSTIAQPLLPGRPAWLLRCFARTHEHQLLIALDAILAQHPLRVMSTPGGQKMSVKTSSCGALGWVFDQNGYRYESIDPANGQPWPAMPDAFSILASSAASSAGFEDFKPDTCLINCYEIGAKMGLHQDKDERDCTQPIVSVSFGLAATFLWGGFARSDRALRVPLAHGDVVVWGGIDRLRYHGVLPIKPAHHPLLGNQRINLTFRKAG